MNIQKPQHYRAIHAIVVSLFLAMLCVIPGFGETGLARAQAALFDNRHRDPDCAVRSVEKLSSTIGNGGISPTGNFTAITQLDANGVYQVYVAKAGSSEYNCITCEQRPGGPAPGRNKPMLTIHPSGQWLVVGVEEDNHDLSWLPTAWQRGLLQSGIWLNIWVTTPTGDRWYQITNFENGQGTDGPANGYVGTPFTPDGKKVAWAEIVNGDVFANAFGVWRLHLADFVVGPDGTPAFVNNADITPAGAKWVEPGNFAPDNRHLLLSTDIGLSKAWGQDQWSIDVTTGQLQQLTDTPNVWDEHGLYSPDGRKISFMSSYPYQNEPNSDNPANLKTEFMLMNADGSDLQQLTHFNVPGYPESQPSKTVAAVAGFLPGNGSTMFATTMSPDGQFSTLNWLITFDGPCGKLHF